VANGQARRVRQLSHDGLTFDVVDEGPLDAEHAVVMLHGFPQTVGSFADVARPLHEAGLRTLAPSQRGYSPGARPASRDDYRIGAIAGDVVALLDAAGVDRADVVGHDWGGMAAWAVAGLHPGRVASLTVLSTPHPAALAWSFTHSSQALRSWYMGFFQLPWLPERLLAPRIERQLRATGVPAPLAAEYARALQEPGALTGALGWYRGMRASRQDHIGHIPVPTTYAWGRRDFALGRAAALQTRRYVDAAYLFVELDAGHWLPENHAGEVAALVLDRVRSG
jgi:pimeloyl-ACP methyl ester carboxylesterase